MIASYGTGVAAPTGVWLLTEELYVLDGVTLQVNSDGGTGTATIAFTPVYMSSRAHKIGCQAVSVNVLTQ